MFSKLVSILSDRYFRLFVLAGLSAVILSAVFLLLNGNQTSENTAAITEMPVLSGDKAISHLRENGSYNSLAEVVQAARYKIEKSEQGATANNNANGLQLNFSSKGLQLKSSTNNKNRTSDWSLKSFGYGTNQTAAEKGELQTKDNRVELKREKQNLTEWFVNKTEGVEHGFTIAKRPAAETDNEVLRLVMKVDGDLKAKASADGQVLTLSDEEGSKILSYDKLKVWDADNKDLTARMRTNKTGNEVWLEVEDKTAKYPLTIDPTFTQQQKLNASDAASADIFGAGVAISGNTAIIGANGDDVDSKANQGSAYVFVRNGTTWTEQQKLLASDGEAGDEFGSGVAISGNTVIVGAGLDNIDTKSDQGSAYIFVRNGTTWTEQQKLLASDGEAGDRFGVFSSVAINGDTAIVGARDDDTDSMNFQGSAYIFVRSGTTWTEQQKLLAADGDQGDFFGGSVAIADNTVIIGANGDDFGNSLSQGSAYIFVRNGTTWSEQQKLFAADGETGDSFGISVAISGDTVIIGSYFDAIDTKNSQGSAYTFVRSGVMWTQQQKLTASDGEAGDRFGGGVAISGNTAIVGAYKDDIDTIVDQGSVYNFVRSGTTWSQQQKLVASDGAAGDEFGLNVAISGGTIVVGARLDDTDPNTDQGSAYIFNSDTSLSASPGAVIAGGTITVNFTAPAGHSATDRIGLFRVGSPNTAFIDIQNVPAGTSGTLTFTAPTTPGQYEFRYLPDGGTNITAVSNTVTVTSNAPQNADTVGVFRSSNGITYLRNSNTGGFADISFVYGVSGDKSIAGDWDNDGKDSLGIYRNGVFYLRNSNTTGPGDIVFAFGAAGDQPIAGDWNGDGTDTVGVYRPTTGVFMLRNSNSAGPPDTVFVLGNPNDVAIAGDWNGDGIDTTGVFRPSNGFVFLKNTNTTGNADISFIYGVAGDKPVAGDWDGDGNDSVGIYRDGIFYLRNSNTLGVADIVFAFGNAGDEPIAGDWDGLP